jgi:hypothetical protein
MAFNFRRWLTAKVTGIHYLLKLEALVSRLVASFHGLSIDGGKAGKGHSMPQARFGL